MQMYVRTALVIARGAGLMLLGMCSWLGRVQGDDVSLGFSSYLGGELGDWADGTATDADGMLYVVGTTGSDPFFLDSEVTTGGNGVFVAKIDPENSVVVWEKYFGGGFATGIAVGPAGVYAMGWTLALDFFDFLPAGVTGADTVKEENTGRDPFVFKLDPADGTLEAATYVNGSGSLDFFDGIVLDPQTGRVYASGRTNTRSTDAIPIPTTDGSTVSCAARGKCNVDLLLAVFSADLMVLEHCTVIGGFDIDAQIRDSTPVAVGPGGVAYLAGYTESDDFPVTDGSTMRGREDGLLVVIDLLPGGNTSVLHAGYIGGGGVDRAYAVAHDGSSLWIGGLTESSDFPAVTGAIAGQSDAYVTKLDPNAGHTILHTTLLGGSSDDSANVLAIDSSGSVYLSGITFSPDFPVSSDAHDTTHNGGSDGVVAKLDQNGASIYATFLGGMHDEARISLSLSTLVADPPGTVQVRVAGGTNSDNFPVLDPLPGQETSGGGTEDGFVASYRFVSGPPAENCSNGVDDDGDGLADCADSDCMLDVDLDGVLAAPCGGDCDDADPSVPAAGEICGDNKDNDCNGLTDCEESPLCDLDPACEEPDCGQHNDPCGSDDDCCSGNCRRNGRCAGGAALMAAVFLRGDSNDDGAVSIIDSVVTLNYLFAGGRQPTCLDAADADDSGEITPADAVTAFGYLFADGAMLPAPYPTFGVDPTFDGLGCEE